MKNIILPAVTAALVASCVVPVHAAVWLQQSSGTYSWTDSSNWNAGTLPQSDTPAIIGRSTEGYVEPGGRQTITGDGVANEMDVATAIPVKASAVRTFAGNITASWTVFRSGTNEISGNLTLVGAGKASRVGTSSQTGGIVSGVLDILPGGSVRSDVKHIFYVGKGDDSNAAASGRIRLRDGGLFYLYPADTLTSEAGLMLGRTNDESEAPWFASSYVQDGGLARLSGLIAGYERNANASVTVSGGVLDLLWSENRYTRFIVGHGGYGIFQQLGGTVYVNTNHVMNTLYLCPDYAFTVGGGKSSDRMTNACFYACGGAFVNGSAFLIQGPLNAETGVLPATATIDGNASVTTRSVRVGANAGDGMAVLNLNGGELNTLYLNGLKEHAGVSEINANGGTVSFPADSKVSKNQFLYLDRINIHQGGLTVRCDSAVNFGTASEPALLRAPAGFGVESLKRSVLNSCVYPPRIEILGGSGSNATALALIDYNSHRMTNIVVTCRGEGYKADDEITVMINRANATHNSVLLGTVTVGLSENSAGPLVKTGPKSLTLYSQPEFDGTYEVREGTMIQSTAAEGSASVSAIVVGGTDAVFQCGSADDTATVAKRNPVNSGAALTLGTVHGPGVLAVPAAADGESGVFEQTFASLTVKGAGNAITMAKGNTAANGAKVIFGDIDCPEGSELTIPDWDSPFKVYVSGQSAHSVFRRVKFAGTGYSAAVGKDGQLVPAPGFMLSIR